MALRVDEFILKDLETQLAACAVPSQPRRPRITVKQRFFLASVACEKSTEQHASRFEDQCLSIASL